MKLVTGIASKLDAKFFIATYYVLFLSPLLYEVANAGWFCDKVFKDGALFPFVEIEVEVIVFWGVVVVELLDAQEKLLGKRVGLEPEFRSGLEKVHWAEESTIRVARQ